MDSNEWSDILVDVLQNVDVYWVYAMVLNGFEDSWNLYWVECLAIVNKSQVQGDDTCCQKIAILIWMQFWNDIIKSGHGFKAAQKFQSFMKILASLFKAMSLFNEVISKLHPDENCNFFWHYVIKSKGFNASFNLDGNRSLRICAKLKSEASP